MHCAEEHPRLYGAPFSTPRTVQQGTQGGCGCSHMYGNCCDATNPDSCRFCAQSATCGRPAGRQAVDYVDSRCFQPGEEVPDERTRRWPGGIHPFQYCAWCSCAAGIGTFIGASATDYSFASSCAAGWGVCLGGHIAGYGLVVCCMCFKAGHNGKLGNYERREFNYCWPCYPPAIKDDALQLQPVPTLSVVSQALVACAEKFGRLFPCGSGNRAVEGQSLLQPKGDGL